MLRQQKQRKISKTANKQHNNKKSNKKCRTTKKTKCTSLHNIQHANKTNLVIPDRSIVDFVPALQKTIIEPSTPRVAIVGSGPSAMYTAKYILQQAPNTHIHIIDRLYTPYGLVRHGIAPDHPEAKNVMLDFEQNVLKHPNVVFIGGVCIDEQDPQEQQQQVSSPSSSSLKEEDNKKLIQNNNKNITLKNLYQHYHGIILATGAQRGRKLGLKHESSAHGVYDAQEFVNWYNGHPDYNELSPTLQNSKNAIIIGNGNVSLDVARFILAPPEYHNNSDIPLTIRNAKALSNIDNVYVVARRSVVDAAYTIPELREILTLSTQTWNKPSQLQGEGGVEGQGDDSKEQKQEQTTTTTPYCTVQFINASIDDLHPTDRQIYDTSRPIKRKTDLLMDYLKKAQKFDITKDEIEDTTAQVFNIEQIAEQQQQDNNNSNNKIVKIRNNTLYQIQQQQQQDGDNNNIPKKTLTFVFNAKPDEIVLNDNNNIDEQCTVIENNTDPTLHIKQPAIGMQFALTKKITTDENNDNNKTTLTTSNIKFQLPININNENNNTVIVKSIGYQTLQLTGAPFNHKKAIYPTDLNGRLITNPEEQNNNPTFIRSILTQNNDNNNNNTQLTLTTQSIEQYPAEYDIHNPNTQDVNNKNKEILKQLNNIYIPFVYATGWARRGPNGIIGANIGDAKEVATTCVNDLKKWSQKYFSSNNNNNEQQTSNSEDLTQLPALPTPIELWKDVPYFATTQNSWHKIRQNERDTALSLNLGSWEPIKDEELKKDVDARRAENVPSVKINDWATFVRIAQQDDKL